MDQNKKGGKNQNGGMDEPRISEPARERSAESCLEERTAQHQRKKRKKRRMRQLLLLRRAQRWQRHQLQAPRAERPLPTAPKTKPLCREEEKKEGESITTSFKRVSERGGKARTDFPLLGRRRDGVHRRKRLISRSQNHRALITSLPLRISRQQ